MKKTKAATKASKAAEQTMTPEEARSWAESPSGRSDLARMAALPDETIDTTDIPEVKSLNGWVRNPFYPL
jgi:hypothetical protein